ncbi:hypothetical protein D9758_010204 [Tetrapyrgos nigripes]|uniref:Uncharacterized protein n=1 Tax=Tetrapyrgos nigripes TaxID=182062 RepID=A0A8H5CY87_9AGAR|nr:hypothetical protein D9758_010204 [Tetrapyrgos nigripes]
MDGKYGAGMTTTKAAEDTIDGVRTSEESLRHFLFSKLDLTDDDAFLGADHGQIGEIKVKYNEVGIRLGCQQVVAKTTFIQVVRKELWAKMIFRYRPLDILQANGIAPPPEPVAGEKRSVPPGEVLDLTFSEDENEGEGDAEEIQALEAKLAALRNKRRKVSVNRTWYKVRARARDVLTPWEGKKGCQTSRKGRCD